MEAALHLPGALGGAAHPQPFVQPHGGDDGVPGVRALPPLGQRRGGQRRHPPAQRRQVPGQLPRPAAHRRRAAPASARPGPARPGGGVRARPAPPSLGPQEGLRGPGRGGIPGLHGVREGLPERRDPGGERRRGPEGIGENGTPRETNGGRSVPRGPGQHGAAGGGEEPPHGCWGQDPPAAGAAVGIWHGARARGWPGTRLRGVRLLCQPPDTKLGLAQSPPSQLMGGGCGQP